MLRSRLLCATLLAACTPDAGGETSAGSTGSGGTSGTGAVPGDSSSGSTSTGAETPTTGGSTGASEASSTGASGVSATTGGAETGGSVDLPGEVGWRSVLYPEDWTPAFTGPEGRFLHDFSYAGYRNGETELAQDLAEDGIRVVSIAPGLIETPMTAGMNEKALERLRASVPLGRIGKPEDIFVAVKFIIECDFFTGQTIDVDGGGAMG